MEKAYGSGSRVVLERVMMPRIWVERWGVNINMYEDESNDSQVFLSYFFFARAILE